ncbi:hypothetical protein [Paludibacterium purpuratum]|uniref:Uncharacterized protein n=1 Tax=Paludibacterium purpuratum TaxID=1144873 RepID=A0A4V3DU99_9NEIS|nr:hypothetical protein [Paludibacterium purpuratum]TDR71622.1 hypothetical protein DFP86_11833 [Paludibacterium purpuratum]
MTEPKKPKPDPQNWQDADLPILTDVDDDAVVEGVEIPEFDFSDELDRMANTLGAPKETPLEFPPELLLDDVVGEKAAPGEGPIDFDQLPSLDLDGEVAPDGSEFVFELEPVAGGEHGVSELDATVARAEFDGADIAEAAGMSEQHAEPLSESDTLIPELTLDDVLPGPSSADTLSQDAPPPELASQLSAIPELMLDDVLDDTVVRELVSDAPLEPMAEVPLEEPVAVEAAPMLDDLPVLEDEQPEPMVEVPPEEPVAVEAAPMLDDLPVLEDVQFEPMAEVPPEEPVAVEAAPMLDDLPVLEDEQPEPMVEVPPEEPVAVEAAPMLDDLPVLEDVQPEAMAEVPPEEPVAVEATPMLDDLPVLEDVQFEPMAEVPPEEPVAVEATPMLDDLPVLEDVQPEAMAEVPPEEPVAVEAAPMLDDLPVLEDVQPEAMAEVPPEEPVVVESTPMLDDLPVLEDVPAEPTPEPVSLEESSVAEMPTGGEPFRSISLDSLPRGVLGGGRALAEAEAEENDPSVQDLIRAAERTLAQERLKQASEQAMPFPASDVTDPVVAPTTQAAEPVSGASMRPVEIINVAGLASSPAPQTFNLPPVRKSYVTLVDEAMLIDSLYDKILPRMKVELSLWLQDALDHQSKQMLSGVMHQLKEDYEMLFSETLRESLRQAIAEMGREDRGERY